ncbi:unnamed protein product [Hydatigera taeniaeformis]|uniref:DUF4283 domain-containing protein n=1 Tax=Hydatigena taeniaeformis TaxID=6205 RepID=A0A0R3WL36_HYDTA|nr:unnamed protein product [Hydatigera taeniaeformis]
MSLDCVHFAPPTDIKAELTVTGEYLLVQLQFPGVGKLSLPPPPQQVHKGSVLFSCFSVPKKRIVVGGSTWMKLIDDKAPLTVMRSGEWIPIQMEKKSANGEIWLRVFRRRISVMLIPPKQEKNATRVNTKMSVQEGPPVTRYYYWDSGRLSKALNPHRSEICVDHDHISLRLACNAELWTEEDVNELQKAFSKEAEVEPKAAPDVQLKHDPVSETTANLASFSQECRQLKCPGGDTNPCRQNVALALPVTEERQLEGVNDTTEAMEKVELLEEDPMISKKEITKAIPSERTSYIDTETHTVERHDSIIMGQNKGLPETTSIKVELDRGCRELQRSNTEVEGKDEVEKERSAKMAEDSRRIDRSTSCTDLCKVEDAATDTTTERGKMYGDPVDGERCHYCLGVREQVGKAEFCALQARVEAMDKEEWGRVLDIIIGKSGDRRRVVTHPQPPIRVRKVEAKVENKRK